MTRRIVLAWVATLFCGTFAAAAARAADAISIEKLVADKTQWPSYAASGQPMRIEGRYLIFSSNLVRFIKCEDLNFVWHDADQSFPVDLTALRSRTIEVYGRFALRSDKPYFSVERVRELPSDAEAVRIRKLALADAPAADWYRAGQWALGRGAFYGDFELGQEARAFFAEGVKRELKTLPDNGVEAKIALSEKFRTYRLPEADRLAFLNEAFARRWLSIKDAHPGARVLEQFTSELCDHLRGCTAPLDQPATAVADRYWRNPADAYREVPPSIRLRMNRILYSTARLAYLKAWAREKNLDGLQLADRIDREVPEFHAEAEESRKVALAERLAAAATLSRRDVLKLADLFTQRGEPQKALQAKKAWVTASDERLRAEGRPDDLIQAAHEHQSMLDDSQGAARLLIEAYDKAPELKDTSEQLNRLGWTRADGKWMTQAQAAALPPDPEKQAADSGRLVGMSRDQVRKAMSSRPDSVTRVISAGRLNEVWIYNETAGSRIAIHFMGSSDGHDLKVVRMVQ